jgi:hypothetical protein
MKRRQLLMEKRQEILVLAAKYGVSNIRIFGSVARAEDDEASDIDFLVDTEPGRSLFDLGGLLYELRDMLGCDVDLVTENSLKDRIRQQVMREVVNL